MTDKQSRRQILLEQLGIGAVWTLRQGPSVAHSPAPANVERHAAGPVDEVMIPVLPQTGEQGSTEIADDIRAPLLVPGLSPAGFDWPALEQAVSGCMACRLCIGRKNTVFGVGNRQARWFFVGEGPGPQEDLQGEPFVGPAGSLLDNMIKALGLRRGENTYIANIVKCRPAAAAGHDRPPAAEEVTSCLPFLQRQIELVQPGVIVALGKFAAQSLLGLPADTPVDSLRGKLHNYRGVPVVVTYHPADLLQQPEDKARAWRDLCMALTAHVASA